MLRLLVLLLGPLTAAAQPVASLIELRNASVVRQQWDTSCGAAALATLLTHAHGEPVAEEAVARGMLSRTDPLRVRHRGGFSLLDMKRYATSRGFQAEAYRGISLDELDELAPAIVPISVHGYPHFVVYRGRSADMVRLADPAFGNRLMQRAQFEAAWQQTIAFTVERGGKPGQLSAPVWSDWLMPSDATIRTLLR